MNDKLTNAVKASLLAETNYWPQTYHDFGHEPVMGVLVDPKCLSEEKEHQALPSNIFEALNGLPDGLFIQTVCTILPDDENYTLESTWRDQVKDQAVESLKSRLEGQDYSLQLPLLNIFLEKDVSKWVSAEFD